MLNQSKIVCLGGFLSGSSVCEQGDFFFSNEHQLRDGVDGSMQPEQPKPVKYRKVKISHPDITGDDYYVCETMTDQQARNMVLRIADAC